MTKQFNNFYLKIYMDIIKFYCKYHWRIPNFLLEGVLGKKYQVHIKLRITFYIHIYNQISGGVLTPKHLLNTPLISILNC